MSTIVYGHDTIQNRLPHVPPRGVIGSPMTMTELDKLSIIWVVDKLSLIIQQVCIYAKNVPDLKRLLIHVSDADDFASLYKTEAYDFVFKNPKIRFLVCDPKTNPDLRTLYKAFQPQDWDYEHLSSFQFAFSEKSESLRAWAHHLHQLYQSIMMIVNRGLNADFTSLDSLQGAENLFKNLPMILKHPDMRRWKDLAKNRPAFLVGAGPSSKLYLDQLRAVQNDALIIAADTMLKPLSRAGIEPHILASIERVPEIIQLLNDPAPHPHTYLCSAPVLDPQCFQEFQGPAVTYLSLLPRTPYFPFNRSRFGVGLSCMGLAMALASFLGCDPIYLIGIDLCWDAQGQSHMSDVPYLNEKFYRDQNLELWKSAYDAVNVAGQNVKTHMYWMTFKVQFEDWIAFYKKRIVNLSPLGLKLEGAEHTNSFPEFSKESKISWREKLEKSLPYDSTQETQTAIALFLSQSKEAGRDIENLIKQSSTIMPAQLKNLYKSRPYYETYIEPILHPDFSNLTHADSAIVDRSRDRILKTMPRILEMLEKATKDIENLQTQQRQSGFPLF